MWNRNCECGGLRASSAFATAPVGVYADLTLRRGDIVVTEEGRKVFVGSQDNRHRAADFTRVKSLFGIGSQCARKRRLVMVAAAAQDPSKEAMSFDTRVVFDVAPLERRFRTLQPSW